MNHFLTIVIFKMTFAFGVAVLLLTLVLLIQKAVRNFVHRYRASRRDFYKNDIMRYLCDEDIPIAQFRPQKIGDADVILKMLLDSADMFKGEMTDRLRVAFEETGLVDRSLTLLQSRRWWVRAEAAYHLGRMRSPKAIEPLLLGLHDTSHEVWLEICQSLADLSGEPALKPILRSFQDASRWTGLEIAEIFLSMGPVAVPVLIEAMNGNTREARLLSIELLGNLRDERAVEPLLIAINDSDMEIRTRSIRALGLIGSLGAVTSILPKLKDEHWPVRLLACEALGRLSAGEVVPDVRQCLHDPEKRVRLKAAEALAHLGDAGAAALTETLEDPDVFTRRAVRQYAPRRPDSKFRRRLANDR